MQFADARALARLTCDHINRSLVPSFYRFLQTNPNVPDIAEVEAVRSEFIGSVEKLVALLGRCERECNNTSNAAGLWSDGGDLGVVDVMAGPCMSSSS